jgi:hypothetical protein
METKTVETIGGYWTLKGASEVVGKSFRTLQTYARFRRFPTIMVGGTVLVKLQDLRVVPGVAERLDAMKGDTED